MVAQAPSTSPLITIANSFIFVTPMKESNLPARKLQASCHWANPLNRSGPRPLGRLARGRLYGLAYCLPRRGTGGAFASRGFRRARRTMAPVERCSGRAARIARPAGKNCSAVNGATPFGPRKQGAGAPTRTVAGQGSTSSPYLLRVSTDCNQHSDRLVRQAGQLGGRVASGPERSASAKGLRSRP
jgi:hypothetical protein